MADAFVGEIRLFAGPVVPSGWKTCDGSLLNIQQNAALYSLLYTQFGGDGKTTFALPDLRSRVIVGAGVAVSTNTNYKTGVSGGTEGVILTSATVPPHTHTVTADAANGVVTGGNDNYFATPVLQNTTTTGNLYVPPSTAVPLNPKVISTVGGDAAHENRQPYLAVSYCICVSGLYPPRS